MTALGTTSVAAGAPFYVDEGRPFAGRNSTMSLDVINPKTDVAQRKIQFPRLENYSLKTSDIAGAKARGVKFLNKEDLSVGTAPVTYAGGKPRSYYPAMDRRPRDLSLTTKDIEYACPASTKLRSQRHTDPVAPVYDMPKSEPAPHSPRYFSGRHTNDISDIAYSKPRKLMQDRKYIRDPNDVSDIERTKPNFARRLGFQTLNPQKRLFDSMNVTDINDQARGKTGPRGTNPLEPTYRVDVTRQTSLPNTWSEEQVREWIVEELHSTAKATRMLGALDEVEQHVGPVAGAKPRKLQWDNQEPLLSLMRDDIPGACPQRWIGGVPYNVYDAPEKRPVISFHDPGDIPGAQVGSNRKGLANIRNTHPLQPCYTMLDGSLSKTHSTVDLPYGVSLPQQPRRTHSMGNLRGDTLKQSGATNFGLTAAQTPAKSSVRPPPENPTPAASQAPPPAAAPVPVANDLSRTQNVLSQALATPAKATPAKIPSGTAADQLNALKD